jgi:hypothetical protein
MSLRKYIPISRLSPIVSLNDADALPINDTLDNTQSPVGSTKKITLLQLRDYAQAGNRWQRVTSGTLTLAPNVNYSAQGVGLINFSLPTTAVFGDTYIISGPGAGLFKINQHAGQSIIFNTNTTTVGTGGYIQSTISGNSLFITCMEDGLLFQVISYVGAFTVV